MFACLSVILSVSFSCLTNHIACLHKRWPIGLRANTALRPAEVLTDMASTQNADDAPEVPATYPPAV
jgi:hypothetical protein